MKKIVFVFVLLFSVPICFSESLAIQIVQSSGTDSRIFATSYLFEQSIIDYFFSSGHIVSNSAVFVKSDDEETNKKEFNRVMKETVEGGMEWLVRVEVEYGVKNSRNPESFLLDNITKVTWTSYSSKSGKKVSSGTEKPSSSAAKDNSEHGITGFSNKIASKISAEIGRR